MCRDYFYPCSKLQANAGMLQISSDAPKALYISSAKIINDTSSFGTRVWVQWKCIYLHYERPQ